MNKFKVGEICEAETEGRWVECEIISCSIKDKFGKPADYGIKAPSVPSAVNDNCMHCIQEYRLRKKFHPPKDQWEKAEDDFIRDFMGQLPASEKDYMKIAKAMMEKRDG